MNRSTSRLKPLAPKPESSPRPSHFFPVSGPLPTNHDGKNINAFAGSHLGVPAGPLENVTSMDPKDYVWGVPQSQPGLFTAPGFASQPLYSPVYHNPHTSFGTGMQQPTYSLPQASGPLYGASHNLAGTNGIQHLQHVQTGLNGHMHGTLGARSSDVGAPVGISQPLPIVQPDSDQAGPALDQVDDLLNIQFDDDCIKKLLGEPNSGPGALEGEMFGSPGVVHTPAECSSPHGKGTSPVPSHNSTATGEDGGDCLQMDLGYGAASSGHDILDATDLHFPMEETSVLETMSGFGDLDLQILEAGTLSEVETTSACMLTHPSASAVQNAVQLPPSPRALKRAKSECGTTGNQVLQTAEPGEYNPLLSLAVNDALASINGFLASNLSSVPEEKRQAALQAIAALQAVPDSATLGLHPSADAVAALTKSNSYPNNGSRRKRVSPRLNAS